MISRLFRTSLAFAVALALPAAALAQTRAPRAEQPATLNPRGPSYGPGVYTENGFTVHVPRNCYVSREQVRQGGQLVWRPLVTCPFDDFR